MSTPSVNPNLPLLGLASDAHETKGGVSVESGIEADVQARLLTRGDRDRGRKIPGDPHAGRGHHRDLIRTRREQHCVCPVKAGHSPPYVVRTYQLDADVDRAKRSKGSFGHGFHLAIMSRNRKQPSSGHTAAEHSIGRGARRARGDLLRG